jgi:hypothetical protein
MTGSFLSIFTAVHVAISLIGIGAGFLILFGFIAGRALRGWNYLFLVMTILTSVTGFFFRFKGFTPGIVVGIISLVVLAVSVLAWRKDWTKTYIITAAIAQFFNVLVLVVQVFQKVPPLHALAPTGTEPVTTIAKLAALVVVAVLAVFAVRKSSGLTL